MPKPNRKEIHGRAIKPLEASPHGIRWGQILKAIHSQEPETPQNSIHGAIQTLFTTSDEIVKITRGTYQLRKYLDDESAAAVASEDAVADQTVIASVPGGKEALTEQDFYESFAEWLEDNDEATVAAALGGASLGGKWGTPDVIGVLKPRALDIFKFEPQIVTAEIKAAPGQPVVAF